MNEVSFGRPHGSTFSHRLRLDMGQIRDLSLAGMHDATLPSPLLPHRCHCSNACHSFFFRRTNIEHTDMAICPLPLRLALPQTPPVPPRWPPATPCSPASPPLRRPSGDIPMLFPRKKYPFNLTKPPPFISFTRIYKFPCLSYSVKDPRKMKITYSPKPLQLKEKTCDVVLLIARFINACDAVQIRLASEKFSPIKSPPNPNSINIKLFLAVAARVLSPVTTGPVSVLSALSQPFASSSRLSSLFVVTAPMHVVNAIPLETYKNILHEPDPWDVFANFTISLPKCASTTTKSSFKTWCTPYIDVGMRYNDGKISELEAVVLANSSEFEKDNNLGLVKQAVSSLYKRNIRRLTQKYLTLSLQDIANMVQLGGNACAPDRTIQDGQIHALINQKVGMVRFLEDPEQYKTSEMIEIMDSVIQRTIGLSKNLIAMDESLSCDPLYLGKVGKERQRYDFGDDFDTVPQKFSM
ncbi:hypothetical protein HID58_008699 [Brassica napus]|uniref:PCI domain-containing protein n=1 Tax=Brassica napus TaxID=3708 RepID=A0ABQ8DRB2_BRANA|nr:hypothetical protein HID58_008699 [Brassica napus]